MTMTISNNEAANRFEAEVDGSLVFVDYTLNDQTLTLVHTQVPEDLEGRGLGSRIVRFALDYAKNHGLQVVPRCPFVSSYIERHAEYADLVAD